MVLVEFFEKDSVENICSSLTNAADIVYMVGSNIKIMRAFAERYKTVLDGRGIHIEIRLMSYNKNSIENIINVLTRIIEENEEVAFDLTGGDDLSLVAAGMIYERYKSRNIQMHRFNLLPKTIIDVDMDGETIVSGDTPQLTVDELIKIYGGDVIYDEVRDNTTYRWDMNEEFKQDIRTMWSICSENTGLWNTQTTLLAYAEKTNGDEDLLTVSVQTSVLNSIVAHNNGGYCRITVAFFHELLKAGLLTSYTINNDVFSVTYKNHQVKYCLTMAGLILEMKVFLTALELKEKDGKPVYNDVMNGVIIDWDGNIHPDHEEYDTENEIDVIIMHGMVPIFVSCKNGYIEKEELYKLNAVAERFGGKYAKKVLVASALEDNDYGNYIRQRAQDMGIRIVEGQSKGSKYKDLTYLSDDEWNKIVRSLWLN